MCKNQILVSHNSTASEVTYVDASLRIDAPALDLWDLVVEVLHSSSNQPKALGNLLRDKHFQNIPTKEQRSSLTRRKILAGQMLLTSLQTHNFVAAMHCLKFLKTVKQ